MNNKRIAKWDNVKFLMMLSVVIGHSLYYFNSVSGLSRGIYLFLYTFHMPVFIFITGVFAKHTVQKRKYESVFGLLFIYVVIKFTETIGDYISKGKLEFHFLWEAGPAWYALVIALFLFVTMLIKDYNSKAIFGAAVFIGCLAGLDTHFGDHYASMRICVFYPVFLAGYYLSDKLLNPRESQESAKNYFHKLISLAVVVGVGWVCAKYGHIFYPYINLLKGKVAYNKLGFGIEGVALRLACYIFWGIMIFSIINLCPGKHHVWTWLGSRTMSIYVWHYIVILVLAVALDGKSFIMQQCPTYYIWAIIVIACMIAIITAYLPSCDIRKQLVKVKTVDSAENSEGAKH